MVFFLTSSIHFLKRCSAYVNSNFHMIILVFLLLFIRYSKQLEIKYQLLNILCSYEEAKYQDNRLTGALPSSGRFSLKKSLLMKTKNEEWKCMFRQSGLYSPCHANSSHSPWMPLNCAGGCGCTHPAAKFLALLAPGTPDLLHLIRPSPLFL